MKLTIETKKLSGALHAAAVAVEHRTTLPILGNIKFDGVGRVWF
jgi:DNA polymerase III sliding clamp (beta) subunit (PCNA family)